eukprot:scaffold39905_cov80-Phaeocystis_antarctica.AAC.4
MQAHNRSGVVMDIAAFKVSHSVDKDTAALRAARARSSSTGAMEEMCSRKAHIVSFILVHVGVGQRCRARDVESPALLPTMSTRHVTQRGRWTMGYYAMWVQLSRGLTSVATLS